MNELRCTICGAPLRTCVVCYCVGGRICMDHCPDCEYFAGRATWNCRYKEKDPPQETRGARAVADFRQKMKDIEKRISAKCENPYT